MNKTGSYIFGEDEPDEMFELLTPQSYQILDELPAEAIDFYKKWQLRGEKSAPFMARVPHVMVKGRVDIAGCRTINWQEPMSV